MPAASPFAKKWQLSMARLTAGFSGADLENLINEAAIFAARRDRRTIGSLEFQDAFDRVADGAGTQEPGNERGRQGDGRLPRSGPCGGQLPSG